MMSYPGQGGVKQVIAINCCNEQATPFIAERLRQQQIECLDILSYASYQAFERSGLHTELFRHLPLLFILHGEDLVPACHQVASGGTSEPLYPFSDN